MYVFMLFGLQIDYINTTKAWLALTGGRLGSV